MGLLPMPTQGGTAMADPDMQGAMPTSNPYDDQQEAGEGNVSPEEQAEYDAFVTAASEMMHGGEKERVMPEILEALRAAKEPPAEADPDAAANVPGGPAAEDQAGAEAPSAGNFAVLALANTAVQIVQKLDVDGRDSGKPVSDDVLANGAVEVIEMLADIAQAAGIYDYSEEETTGAFYQAIDLYRPIAIEMGRTDEETLKGQFAEIDAADKAGRLEEILPGAGGQTVGEPPMGPVATQ